MSFHLSNLAWDIELRCNQKIILLALAHLGVQSTGEATPTVARLAFMCGLSDSCVRAQLKRMVAKGYISSALIEGKGGYRLNALLVKSEAAEPAVAESEVTG